MGRLIDADKFKVYLQEYLGYGHAIPWVDAQPTAYDVEKVVAELEELANHYHKCCLVDYNEGAEVGVRESMTIVRKGGVSR